MFATYLANTIVFVVGTATEVEIPIGFSVALACVLANRLCLNTRGLVRRSRFLRCGRDLDRLHGLDDR